MNLWTNNIVSLFWLTVNADSLSTKIDDYLIVWFLVPLSPSKNKTQAYVTHNIDWPVTMQKSFDINIDIIAALIRRLLCSATVGYLNTMAPGDTAFRLYSKLVLARLWMSS